MKDKSKNKAPIVNKPIRRDYVKGEEGAAGVQGGIGG